MLPVNPAVRVRVAVGWIIRSEVLISLSSRCVSAGHHYVTHAGWKWRKDRTPKGALSIKSAALGASLLVWTSWPQPSWHLFWLRTPFYQYFPRKLTWEPRSSISGKKDCISSDSLLAFLLRFVSVLTEPWLHLKSDLIDIIYDRVLQLKLQA